MATAAAIVAGVTIARYVLGRDRETEQARLWVSNGTAAGTTPSSGTTPTTGSHP